jgi:phosphoribosylanthranilate isomerase
MFVKICGITTAAAVEAAVAAGADALGFVFADSVRQITPERAVELTADLSLNTARVAVMLHPSPAYWNLVRDVFKPDWLQTDVKDFSLLDVPDHIGHLPVYRDTMDIDPEITDWPEHLLFEGKRSGQGALADWDRAAVIARRSCIMLAGGLNPDNVTAAITRVHPWGVDVSSGVESEPGVKDVNKIAAFIDAARKVENHAGQ